MDRTDMLAAFRAPRWCRPLLVVVSLGSLAACDWEVTITRKDSSQLPAGAPDGRPHAPPPRSQVTPGTPDVHGALSRAQLERAALEHSSALADCHDRAPSAPAEVAVSVKFIVSPEGGVHTAAIDNSKPTDAVLNACILHELRTWTLPASTTDSIVVVGYPFVFRRAAQ